MNLPFTVALSRGAVAAFTITLLVCGTAFITDTELSLGHWLVIDDRGPSTTLSVSLAVPFVLAIAFAVGLWGAARLYSSATRRSGARGDQPPPAG